MIFKPGDKVFIVNQYSNLMDGDTAEDSLMLIRHAESIMTIDRCYGEDYNKDYSPTYSMIEDNGRWTWFPNMLKPADSRKKITEVKLNNLPDI